MSITIEKEFNEIKQHVLETIEKYVKENNLEVSESTMENLAIHLALSISRTMNDTYIYYSESQLLQCKNLETYPIAKEIIKELADEYHIEFNKIDSYYAAMYLANLSLLDLDFDIESDIVDDDVEDVMDEALDKIKDELGYDLRQKTDFYQGITLHFYPAIERLKADEQLDSNPLADIISAQNEREYQCAEILNNVVEEHYHKSFNQNELGYITLHFGTAFYTKG